MKFSFFILFGFILNFSSLAVAQKNSAQKQDTKASQLLRAFNAGTAPDRKTMLSGNYVGRCYRSYRNTQSSDDIPEAAMVGFFEIESPLTGTPDNGPLFPKGDPEIYPRVFWSFVLNCDTFDCHRHEKAGEFEKFKDIGESWMKYRSQYEANQEQLRVSWVDDAMKSQWGYLHFLTRRYDNYFITKVLSNDGLEKMCFFSIKPSATKNP